STAGSETGASLRGFGTGFPGYPLLWRDKEVSVGDDPSGDPRCGGKEGWFRCHGKCRRRCSGSGCVCDRSSGASGRQTAYQEGKRGRDRGESGQSGGQVAAGGREEGCGQGKCAAPLKRKV